MRKVGVYEKYIKRPLDFVCAIFVIVFFWWLYVILAILVRIKLGSPVIFLRSTSLDEIPNILNILKGDMSLI